MFFTAANPRPGSVATSERSTAQSWKAFALLRRKPEDLGEDAQSDRRS